MDIHTVLLTGRPGSGKGTQAAALAESFGWAHFSTGNRFREMREGTGQLAERVREVYDAGKLMPDWFATYLFEETLLNLAPDKGIVIEGYPRSHTQAEIFDDIMTWLGRPYAVFDLAVSEEETIRRQIERSKVENRPDSGTEAQIRVRLDTYNANTEPVLDFFRDKGMLGVIDGEMSPEDVTKALKAAIQPA